MRAFTYGLITCAGVGGDMCADACAWLRRRAPGRPAVKGLWRVGAMFLLGGAAGFLATQVGMVLARGVDVWLTPGLYGDGVNIGLVVGLAGACVGGVLECGRQHDAERNADRKAAAAAKAEAGGR